MGDVRQNVVERPCRIQNMYIAGPHNGATENARPGSVRRGVSTNNVRKSEEPADRGDDANDHGSKQSSPSHAHLRSNPRSTKNANIRSLRVTGIVDYHFQSEVIRG